MWGWGGVGWGGDDDVHLHLHTCLMLRNRMFVSDLHTCLMLRNRMFHVGVGWGGVATPVDNNFQREGQRESSLEVSLAWTVASPH